MIICPVCSAENGHLEVTCKNCRSFLQTKIETLDLFATLWLLMESPRRAFHRISIARHKNYVVFLSFVFGIALMFFVMWLLRIGDMDVSLLQLLIAGFVLGPVVGFVMLLALAVIVRLVAAVFRLKTRFMNAVGLIAYAMVPLSLSVVFLLPIEIISFGKFFFSTNPSPYLLKPVSYVTLTMLNGLALVWSITLFIVGVRVLFDIGIRKAALFSGITFLIYCGLLSFGVYLLEARKGMFPKPEKPPVTVCVSAMHEGIV